MMLMIVIWDSQIDTGNERFFPVSIWESQIDFFDLFSIFLDLFYVPLERRRELGSDLGLPDSKKIINAILTRDKQVLPIQSA